ENSAILAEIEGKLLEKHGLKASGAAPSTEAAATSDDSDESGGKPKRNGSRARAN
ncbi:MAG: hypothetical protein H6721_32190, partial [Sandaracinus sp.]|nr:hypothetical protein [Sandaracinus sp.]MCB9636795.1 hypothetical protein [Sandaracinus sp.]